jgi:hypothetical protein
MSRCFFQYSRESSGVLLVYTLVLQHAHAGLRFSHYNFCRVLRITILIIWIMYILRKAGRSRLPALPCQQRSHILRFSFLSYLKNILRIHRCDVWSEEERASIYLIPRLTTNLLSTPVDVDNGNRKLFIVTALNLQISCIESALRKHVQVL